MNVPLYGDEFRKLFGNLATLHPSAQDSPNMTIRVSAGGIWTYLNGVAAYVEYIGGSSPAITAPSANAKWVVVCLTSTGMLINVNGDESASPVLPTIPRTYFPIALVYTQFGDTVITDPFVFDARPIFSLLPRYHSDMAGTSLDNCHPTSSITGLDDALTDKADVSTVAAALALKADTDGTNEVKFTMNKDHTGSPSADVIFDVERGSSTNVDIRWDETLEVWKYTNDGAVWHNFTSNDGTEDIMIKTYSQDGEPTLDADNKAAFWIDTNDSDRVYLVFRRGTGDQVKVELT